MSNETTMETPPALVLTERAVEEVKRVMEEQGFTSNEYVLEAGVVGGGCAGYTNKLGFKPREEVNSLTETIYKFGDIDVAVNNRAMLYLQGTTIDFHEDLNKRGFVFLNQAYKSTCGCGSSFSV